MVKKTYIYGSEGGFASTGTASIQKSLKKLSFTVNGVSYQEKTIAAFNLVCANNTSPPGGNPVEVGFKITGTIKKPKQDKGQSLTLNACLGADNGPGTTGSFFSDLGSGTGTIAGATIDGVTSTLTIQLNDKGRSIRR